MPVSTKKLSRQQLAELSVRREALARAIRDARRTAGMTQAQVAEAAGLARSTIIEIENGQRGLGSDAIWNLARALRTRPSVLWAAAEADDDAAETLEPEQ